MQYIDIRGGGPLFYDAYDVVNPEPPVVFVDEVFETRIVENRQPGPGRRAAGACQYIEVKKWVRSAWLCAFL